MARPLFCHDFLGNFEGLVFRVASYSQPPAWLCAGQFCYFLPVGFRV